MLSSFLCLVTGTMLHNLLAVRVASVKRPLIHINGMTVQTVHRILCITIEPRQGRDDALMIRPDIRASSLGMIQCQVSATWTSISEFGDALHVEEYLMPICKFFNKPESCLKASCFSCRA